MLNPKRNTDPTSELTGYSSTTTEFDVVHSLSIIQRRWQLVMIITAGVLLCSLTYISTASSKYTAEANVLVDIHKNQVFEKERIIDDIPVDGALIDSQVEVINSESVLEIVVYKLGLISDPEFVSPSPTNLLEWIVTLTSTFINDSGGPPLDIETKKKRNAIETLTRNLKVKRVDKTYTLEIEYTSLDPVKASKIANSIAEAYVLSDLDAKFVATRRTGEWLQDRIKELRTSSAAADEDVRKFKEDNNLVDTSRGLISQQQLTDLNTQLVQAKTITAEAKAKLDSVESISGDDLTNTKISDALKSDVISRLRAQYLDLKTREGDWTSRLGKDHLAPAHLRDQMDEITRAINAELNRIIDTYASDYQIALARERSIEDSVNKLASQSAGVTGRAQDQLRLLEDTAQAYRSLYQSFVQRATEAAQQESFSVSSARIITPASPPRSKSSPKSLLILAGSIAVGAFVGACVAIARERFDNVFRTRRDVEALTGLECLGIIPKIAMQRDSTVHANANRQDANNSAINTYAITKPFSRFAETLRSVKVAADLSRHGSRTQVLAFVSALPNEGKTLVATNFGALSARSGCRTLLIDADLHRRSMTRRLVGDVDQGLLAVIQNYDEFSKLIWRDAVSGLHLLPTETTLEFSHTSEIISSTGMAEILAAVRKNYDYIVIDLPPIIPLTDARAISELVDKFVMVVEWGSTKREAVFEALAKASVPQHGFLGVILNKADPKMLKRYETYLGKKYYSYYDATPHTDRSV